MMLKSLDVVSGALSGLFTGDISMTEDQGIALIGAAAGLGGVIVGTIIQPITAFVSERKHRKLDSKRAWLEKQLSELWTPMYLNLVVMPGTDPEHYFSEWDIDEFQDWLAKAVAIMEQHLHLLPIDMIGHLHTLREVLKYPGNAELEVRNLYKRIQEELTKTRQELGTT